MFFSSNQNSPFSNPNFIIFKRGTIQREPPVKNQSNSSSTTNHNTFPLSNNLDDFFSNNIHQNNSTGVNHQSNINRNFMEEEKKEVKKEIASKQTASSNQSNKSPQNHQNHTNISNSNFGHNSNTNPAIPQLFNEIFMNFGLNIGNIFTQVFSNNNEIPFHPAFVHIRMNEFANNYNNNFGNLFHIDNSDQSHPVSQEILGKLRTINLGTEHCKKNSKGNLEFPNCAICCSNISLNQKAIILECGHMYHSDCINTWFKTHNTCPICRREIK